MFGGFMIRVQGWRLVEGDSFYDSEVNESIHDLLQQAEEVRMCFGTDRQLEAQYEIVGLQQQLRVSVVPVRILHCESDNNQFDVSVFDMDCKIYCPDYPVQTCGLWKNMMSKCSVQQQCLFDSLSEAWMFVLMTGTNKQYCSSVNQGVETVNSAILASCFTTDPSKHVGGLDMVQRLIQVGIE